jgi:hypothetical protein
MKAKQMQSKLVPLKFVKLLSSKLTEAVFKQLYCLVSEGRAVEASGIKAKLLSS